MAYVLIGFMGAGKSTAAVELATALGQENVCDSDDLLAARFGHSIATEFELHGEEAFRAAEEELVSELLGNDHPEQVIALGGGSVLSSRVREALRGGHVTVLLDVGPETAWQRVQHEARARPLASDYGSFAALHAERAAIYDDLADAVLMEPLPGTIGRVASSLSVLRDLPRGTKLIWAVASSGEYPVLLGRGLLATTHAPLLESWPIPRERSRAFCVSDETVFPKYGERLGQLMGSEVLGAGESYKTLASAERVWTRMVQAGVTRADHVVALGGGCVGDVAGFCAAAYQRGVSVTQVPTTLVAQVDSAYGGKTGVDLPQAKNYVGAYHQPAGVLVDPDTLATLPSAELNAGWVEVLKTALIAGGELWETVAAGGEPDELVIFACARTKLAIVAADERDAGARQVLNLGHTVGHAIETATGYARYRHGEAVGLGLLAALSLSGQDELRARARALMRERDLPVTLEGVSVEAILEAIGRDKKRVGRHVPFVLVRAPGEVEFGCEVAPEDLGAAVAELAA
jgi:shikimate kinase/3-dehydroquinate synthase